MDITKQFRSNFILLCTGCLFCNILWAITLPANAQETNIIQKRAAYIIGAGDVLGVITWTGAESKREEVTVRIDGKITLPLLNDIQASGKTPVQLKKEIEKKLTVFVEAPTATVIVKKQDSKRFFVLGEVLHSGEYPLTKEYKIVQAIALAGGFTKDAEPEEILLIRDNPGGTVTMKLNYAEILKGENLGSNRSLKPNDTILVP